MSFDSLRVLLAVAGLLSVVTIACSRVLPRKTVGNVRLIDRETALESLPGSARVVVILVTNSRDQGFYWLDVESRKLYLAKPFQTSVPPDKNATTWTGTELIYASRLEGFFSLSSDGSHRQITEFDRLGRIARDGRRILRFKKCGPEETGRGYSITPLDRFPEPLDVCIARRVESDPEAWNLVKPVWNPFLSRADFMVSQRIGKARNMKVVSSKLMQVSGNGDLDEIVDLDRKYPDWFENDLQPRPDGQAFYVHDEESETSRILDRRGATVVDFAEVESKLPHLKRTRRFSWSPDSQKAALLFEECLPNKTACARVLVVATDKFSTLKEIMTLPPDFRFNEIIWSPDSARLSFVTEIHQGIDDPPRVYSVDLADGSVADCTLPTRFIVRFAQWIR